MKYLVVGSVTKFGTEEQQELRRGRLRQHLRNRIGGDLERQGHVAITARIISMTTAEIIASAKGDGTSKRSGLLLGGGGGGGGGAGLGRIQFGSTDFRDTILGEATEMAVKSTVAMLIAKKDRLQ